MCNYYDIILIDVKIINVVRSHLFLVVTQQLTNSDIPSLFLSFNSWNSLYDKYKQYSSVRLPIWHMGRGKMIDINFNDDFVEQFCPVYVRKIPQAISWKWLQLHSDNDNRIVNTFPNRFLLCISMLQFPPVRGKRNKE